MQIINIDLPVHTYNDKNYSVESQTLRLDSNGENTIGWVFAKKMEEGKTKCFLYEKHVDRAEKTVKLKWFFA